MELQAILEDVFLSMVMKKTGKIYHQPFAQPMVSVDLTVSLLIQDTE